MPQRTVLIADDDPDLRLALRLRLQALGYDVLECHDGLGALAKCRAWDVDAVILDQQMPAGDGRTVASRLRRVCDVPIIFLSGRDSEEFRATVTRLPDTYYLPKPLDDARFGALLRSIVSGWRNAVRGNRYFALSVPGARGSVQCRRSW